MAVVLPFESSPNRYHGTAASLEHRRTVYALMVLADTRSAQPCVCMLREADGKEGGLLSVMRNKLALLPTEVVVEWDQAMENWS